jgi:methionyl-tRNA formyltransferase
MFIQILVDNPDSWIVPYAKVLVKELNDNSKVEKALLLFKHSEIVKGDVLCLLSCERIFKKLDLNKFNLVVHESDLPKGKGWSPVTWQILEGKNKIPVTLFEANEKVDAGEIYEQDFIVLNGNELLPEIKHQQGVITNKLIHQFVENYPNVKGNPQEGEGTYYEKRNAESSELDIQKTIEEQFNLLRVCDNDRYPAYFVLNGIKYTLKVEKRR